MGTTVLLIMNVYSDNNNNDRTIDKVTAKELLAYHCEEP